MKSPFYCKLVMSCITIRLMKDEIGFVQFCLPVCKRHSEMGLFTISLILDIHHMYCNSGKSANKILVLMLMHFLELLSFISADSIVILNL